MSHADLSTTPIPPSALVRLVLRPMTKLLNPLIRPLAGKKHMSMAAVVYHIGRRSGRAYVTAAGAHVEGDECLVPLTFGTESDWCRNLRAAGGGRIRWKAQDYRVTSPEVRATDSIRPLLRKMFRPHERAFMKMMGIRSFLHLAVVAAP